MKGHPRSVVKIYLTRPSSFGALTKRTSYTGPLTGGSTPDTHKPETPLTLSPSSTPVTP